MCNYLAEKAGLYRIHIFELVDAKRSASLKSLAGQGYPNCNAANPSKGKVLSVTSSNGPVNECRRGSHDWVLKLLATVIPITLPIMAPAANSENQRIVTETASPM